MSTRKHALLQLLLSELSFIEDGGYHQPPHDPWRAPFVFEDSPTCLNFGDAEKSHPCSECLLLQYVPEDLRDREAPCRFIQLGEDGVTIDSLYRTGTEEEIEEALCRWLWREIRRLQAESASA